MEAGLHANHYNSKACYDDTHYGAAGSRWRRAYCPERASLRRSRPRLKNLEHHCEKD